MSVIVEFSISASDFVVGKALQEAPDLSVQLSKMIPVDNATIPYFWVTGDGKERFEAVLEREAELTDIEIVDEVDDRTLYRVAWDSTADTLVQTIAEHDAMLEEAEGDAESWRLRLRFPDTHALSEFHTACIDRGIDISIERLYNPAEPHGVDTREMTDAQRKLMLRAYNEGYFEIPRRITLAELAEELDRSDQSVNERLRRGLSTLIESTLASGTSRTEEE